VCVCVSLKTAGHIFVLKEVFLLRKQRRIPQELPCFEIFHRTHLSLKLYIVGFKVL